MNASANDPLHGVTLERLLTELVEHYGWEELGRHVAVRCFLFEPTIKSSLVFLRKTPWARAKVEAMYVRWKRKESPGHSRKPNHVAGVADPGKFNQDLHSGLSGLDEPGYTKPIPPAAKLPGTPPPAPLPPAHTLTPEEQMALFEKDLKENDWGHQPC